MIQVYHPPLTPPLKGGEYLFGFTLIEMSIVLVIIGLIIGGILVGQALIRSAYIRAQITQIEKFNTAVNTFYGKYQALPGDMNPTVAEANGFLSRPGTEGLGDGNGLLEGCVDSTGCYGTGEGYGETKMFWDDLTYANGMNINLIQGSFQVANFTHDGQCDLPPFDPCFPAAVLGGGNYIFVLSGASTNYYTIQQVSHIGAGFGFAGNWGITVAQSYAIDRKLDDALPTSGNVVAAGISCPGNGGAFAFTFYNPSDCFYVGTAITTGLPASVTSCFDNGGNGGATITYSTSQNNGAGLNCALSFKMQAGD